MPNPVSNTIVSTAFALLFKRGPMTMRELHAACDAANQSFRARHGENLFPDDFRETPDGRLSKVLYDATVASWRALERPVPATVAEFLGQKITVDELLGTHLVDSGAVPAPTKAARRIV